MQWKPISSIPATTNRNSRSNNNRLQSLIMDFYESSSDFAEVEFDFGEYTNSYSLYSGLKKAISSLDIPVEAKIIRGGVYLRRVD